MPLLLANAGVFFALVAFFFFFEEDDGICHDPPRTASPLLPDGASAAALVAASSTQNNSESLVIIVPSRGYKLHSPSSSTATNMIGGEDVRFWFRQMWGLCQMTLYLAQPFLFPEHKAWVVVAWCSAIGVMLWPKFLRFGVFGRLMVHVVRGAFVDSSVWSILTELSVVCLGIPGASLTCSRQLALFYVAAGFWKLNTAFFDLRVSCAPILMVTLLRAILGDNAPPFLLSLAAKASPALTAFGEIGIGALLWFRRPEAVLLTAFLHLGICMTPVPNQIATFSLFALTRVAFFARPRAFAKACSTFDWKWCAASAALMAWLATYNTMPFFNPPLVMYGLAATVAVKASFLSEEETEKESTSRRRKATSWFLVALAFIYSFCLQPLGLVDMGASSPFSSIRMTGGTNHYLPIPLGLLQRYEVGPFAGGYVRVEKCNSTFANLLYPGDASYMLPTEALLEVGHDARQFHATVRRFLREDDREAFPELFTPYTLPVLDLRRLLSELREKDRGPYSMTYSHLPGLIGDERWRALEKTKTIHIEEGNTRICETEDGEECGPEEVAMLPEPPRWALAFTLFFPLPIVYDRHGELYENLPCMD